MRARLAIDVSAVSVELREIVLRDKPKDMLEKSPKGTVPVIIDGENVIDESLDIMHWALNQNDPDGWLARLEPTLISDCDSWFKAGLDAYKYGRGDIAEPRETAANFIRALDEKLTDTPYLGGSEIGMTDMAIVTFVRQYAHVDQDWFYGEPWPHVIAWLDEFKNSDRFARIMPKFPVWTPETPQILFPEAA